ncbi:DotU family type IV/VI secretion system protein, partial [Pseudomonas asiatica]|nr:DotU family type IV/VI secretion system protein [Pseudomonas asiatica]
MTKYNSSEEDVTESVVASIQRAKKKAEEAQVRAHKEPKQSESEEASTAKDESPGYTSDPDFQLRGGYDNLMLDAAAPLFGLVIRLRTLDALPNIKDVHQQVR